MFKAIWIAGMAVTAVVVCIMLLIFRKAPIPTDFVVIVVWPYFLLYAIGFISTGLWALYKDLKKVNKSEETG